MADDPYFKLARMIPEQGDSPGGTPAGGTIYLTGKVTKLLPLSIEAAELMLSGIALKVSANLINPQTGTISGSCSTGGGVSGNCTIPAQLKAGDEVLMLTSDYQVFYVICKVVSV